MMTGRRSERGAILPSPVVMLSIIAIAMAAVAFLATRGGDSTEREITPSAEQRESTPSSTASPAQKKSPKPKAKKKKPAIQRGEVYVEVYNNSNIAGLAGEVAAQAGEVGWNVVGSDNWVGTIPSNTVYYPERLEAEAKQLALDLGIKRTYLAVAPMKLDRLTVILTGSLE